jgi:beta-glucanase (GH16 family)
MIIYDNTVTEQNTYIGGAFQQATSGVSETDQLCYEGTGGCYSVYGFEYKPGFDDAVSWFLGFSLCVYAKVCFSTLRGCRTARRRGR